MAQFSIPIEDIVDLLGLERSPKNHPGARSIKVHCPFCGHNGYTMDVDTVNCVYHCFHCPDDLQKHNGALDLYSRVRMGAPSCQLDRKKVYHQLCKELGHPASQTPRISQRTREIDRDINPTDDAALNAAYSALLQLPYLKLTKQHIMNLMARGLPEDIAQQGKYASVPPGYITVKDHPKGKEISDWYWSNGIERTRKYSSVLSRYHWKEVVAGILIADDLIRQGVELNGVPGFYRVNSQKWAIRYDIGMMIPTISYEGNIVGIQARRDILTPKGLRYMTLSSKGLPDGVTTRIARTHVVHSQSVISENTQVYITEGPLKADIILWYLTRKQEDVAVIALQGVNNKKDIPEIAQKLYNNGIRVVYSAFDMDKCGNTAVAEADRALRDVFQKSGIRADTIVWDSEYAREKKKELTEVAEKNDISFITSGNDFVDIGKLARLLTERHIEYNVQRIDCKAVKKHWRSETKGYDDYLQCLASGRISTLSDYSQLSVNKRKERSHIMK